MSSKKQRKDRAETLIKRLRVQSFNFPDIMALLEILTDEVFSE